MGVEIKLWQLKNDKPEALKSSPVDLESRLEEWIVNDPSVLGEELLIIAQQGRLQGAGRFDLLGVDANGQIVIIELKRNLKRRDAIAQALDYASWLNTQTPDYIKTLADQFLKKPIEQVFAERFQEDFQGFDPQSHRIVVVGTGLDAGAERAFTYLAQKYPIKYITFRCAKVEGIEILARAAESTVDSEETTRRSVRSQHVLALAAKRNVVALLQPFRDLAASDVQYVTEQPSMTYGGSFRYWRRNADGDSKMVFGINVSGGRENAPDGQLDIWLSKKTLAQVLDVSDAKAAKLLQSIDPKSTTRGDVYVRVRDAKHAASLASKIRGWFESYTGFYAEAAGAH